MKKKTLLLVTVFVALNLALSSYAIEPKYLIHTSAKDVEYKKTRAIKWHEDVVESRDTLQRASLKWYEDQIINGKFYFVDAKKELEFAKKKALRWYGRNSE